MKGLETKVKPVFSLSEKEHDITTLPKAKRGVEDETRAMLKESAALAAAGDAAVIGRLTETLSRIEKGR